MKIQYIHSMSEISQLQWQQLETSDSPFLSYEFLNALEQQECVGQKFGWLPRHLLLCDGEQIAAFMPMYHKTNSYGELVFDWSWAEAYQRSGLPYYPKLVSAIPYTPVSSQRILFSRNNADRQASMVKIIDSLKDELETHKFSSFHCLFPTEDEMLCWNAQGFIRRLGCQFHWMNQDYQSFDHYLDFFVSRKRKNIRKERQQVHEQGFTFKMLTGDQIESDLWPIIHAFYEITFRKKGGIATFSLNFFEVMGKLLGKRFLVNLVSYKNKYVACAIFYRDKHKLYGRHWGCFDEFSNLHFETCYYQGLEYAINEELKEFEPGAQGEHKVSRGFLPTKTWSVHWIKEPVFRRAIADFVHNEEEYMNRYMSEMRNASPFKS